MALCLFTIHLDDLNLDQCWQWEQDIEIIPRIGESLTVDLEDIPHDVFDRDNIVVWKVDHGLDAAEDDGYEIMISATVMKREERILPWDRTHT